MVRAEDHGDGIARGLVTLDAVHGCSGLARFFHGGRFSGSTDVVFWRDPKVASRTPVPVGTRPSWYPLATATVAALSERHLGQIQVVHSTDPCPLVTNRTRVGSASLPVLPLFGMMLLDLNRPFPGPTFSVWAQSYVAVLHEATIPSGPGFARSGAGISAVMLESGCR